MKKAELKKHIVNWLKERHISKDTRIVDVFIDADTSTAIVTVISAGTILHQYEIWYDEEYNLKLVGGYHIKRTHYYNP